METSIITNITSIITNITSTITNITSITPISTKSNLLRVRINMSVQRESEQQFARLQLLMLESR